MKNSITSYCVAAAIINALLAYGLRQWAHVVRGMFDGLLEGKVLPSATNLILTYPAWPKVFAIALLLCGILTARSKLSARAGFHILVAMLLVEVVVLFLMLIFVAVPFVSPVCRLTE